MLKKLNNYIYSSILISVVFIILGALCVIKPDISFNAISTTLTCIFIINGLLLLIIDYKNNSIFMNNFLYGVLSLVIGIILLIYPNTLKMILPFTVGLWFMISSLFNLKYSFYLKNESLGYMILTMIMAIISITCGVVLVSRPLESINILTITLGITLLIHSISNIIDMVIIKKYIDKIVKKMKHYISEFAQIDK